MKNKIIKRNLNKYGSTHDFSSKISLEVRVDC